MKNIRITKLEIPEIQVMQEELFRFIARENANLKYSNPDFYSRLLLLDIAHRLHKYFRTRIEQDAKVLILNCSVSEAILLLQVCNDADAQQTAYTAHTLRKFSSILEENMINLM